MGSKTKIDWCDATWNPVTGCKHGCEYCYAKKIAYRFGVQFQEWNTEAGHEWDVFDGTGENHVLDEPQMRYYKGDKLGKAPYPYCFDPTFHRYRLDEPQKWKKPKTIFVCSMADLFGDWVPDEWIKEVFDACEKAPQHRYLFLTKNPKRYFELLDKGIVIPNTVDWRYGYTMDGKTGVKAPLPIGFRTFVSIEPIQGQLNADDIVKAACTEWVILGAETGNRKGKVAPEKEWINEITERCDVSNTPVFMKESLREIMGADFIQEFPWEV